MYHQLPVSVHQQSLHSWVHRVPGTHFPSSDCGDRRLLTEQSLLVHAQLLSSTQMQWLQSWTNRIHWDKYDDRFNYYKVQISNLRFLFARSAFWNLACIKAFHERASCEFSIFRTMTSIAVLFIWRIRFTSEIFRSANGTLKKKPSQYVTNSIFFRSRLILVLKMLQGWNSIY